jgi:hypothetical protein
VIPEDILAVIPSVMRHRIAMNFAAKTDQYGTKALIEDILKQIAY